MCLTVADDEDSSESSPSTPVLSLAEQRKQKEMEESARLKSLERRERALKKAQNWNRRTLAEDEEKEKRKDIKELTRRLQRQPNQQIYKPPSLRTKGWLLFVFESQTWYASESHKGLFHSQMAHSENAYYGIFLQANQQKRQKKLWRSQYQQ